MTDDSKNTSVSEAGTRRHPLRVIALSALAASVLLGIFRCVILNKYIDPVTGLYGNAVIGTLFFVLLALLVAVCLGTYFYAVKHPVARPVRNETVMTAFSATMCGMSFATAAVAGIVSELRSHAMLSAFREHRVAEPVFFVLELLLMIASSVCFWHICVVGAKVKADAEKETLLPVFPALFLGVRTIHIFIDTKHQINASERSFLLLTLVMMMMFFICEARFFVSSRPNDEKDTSEKRFARYFVFALISAVLTTCILVPHSITAAFSVGHSDDLLYYILGLCLGLHAALRVLSY